MQPEPFAPQPQEPEQEPQTAPAQAPTEYPDFQTPQQNNSSYENTQPAPSYEAPQPEPTFQQPEQEQNLTTTPQPQQYTEQVPVQSQEPQTTTQPPFVPVGGLQTAAQDPGKTMGIVGLVFAFVGLQIIGLVLSIIAHNKSKKTGFKNGVAVAGIWVNAISFIFIVIPITLLVFFTAIVSVQENAKEFNSRSSATTVLKITEVYAANNQGKYPTLSELMTSADPSIAVVRDELEVVIVEGSLPVEGQVGYDTCADSYGSTTGAHIYTHESDGTVTESETAGYCPATSESL